MISNRREVIQQGYASAHWGVSQFAGIEILLCSVDLNEPGSAGLTGPRREVGTICTSYNNTVTSVKSPDAWKVAAVFCTVVIEPIIVMSYVVTLELGSQEGMPPLEGCGVQV